MFEIYLSKFRVNLNICKVGKRIGISRNLYPSNGNIVRWRKAGGFAKKIMNIKILLFTSLRFTQYIRIIEIIHKRKGF